MKWHRTAFDRLEHSRLKKTPWRLSRLSSGSYSSVAYRHFVQEASIITGNHLIFLDTMHRTKKLESSFYRWLRTGDLGVPVDPQVALSLAWYWPGLVLKPSKKVKMQLCDVLSKVEKAQSWEPFRAWIRHYRIKTRLCLDTWWDTMELWLKATDYALNTLLGDLGCENITTRISVEFWKKTTIIWLEMTQNLVKQIWIPLLVVILP